MAGSYATLELSQLERVMGVWCTHYIFFTPVTVVSNDFLAGGDLILEFLAENSYIVFCCGMGTI